MSTLRRGKQPLLITNPDLAKEWDYEKNAPLTPNDVTAGSNKKVWWRCNNGHEWSAIISSRSRGNDCPYCSGLFAIVGVNDLATTNPELVDEWDEKENYPLTPYNVKSGSNSKVWWVCKFDHHWQSTVQNRALGGNGCPYCAGQRVLKGYNDLETLFPELAREWNYGKNGELKPDNITSGTSKKVWWICSQGHEWQAIVSNRSKKGSGCPYCSNLKAWPGFNDLATTTPDIAKEWHPTKNDTLTPQMVVCGSERRVWWQCSKGHEWQARLADRKRGHGCPYCAGQRVLKGFNDLATTNPDLAKEWNYNKNGILSPDSISSGNNKKVWWICSKGHEWQSTISSRSSGVGCPICSNKKVLAGYNDLATIKPELTSEWNYEKNSSLTPSEVTPYSEKKVWWKCQFGHEWQSAIHHRSNGRGCPFCSSKGSSMPEQGIAFYLEQCCEIKQRVDLFGYEVDIYLPCYNIGIEYDGCYYHKNRETNDKKKTIVLTSKGVKLFRVIESDRNTVINDSIYYCHDGMGVNYKWAVEKLLLLLYNLTTNEGFNLVKVNIKGDRLKIRERFNLIQKENSLAVLNPEVAKGWDYAKNGKLTPEMFFVNSNEKVWWKCQYNHSWKAQISHRTSKKTGCPYCAGVKILPGFNDLQTLCPDLAKQWNYAKNDKLLPSMVTIGTNRIVWWVCSEGHEWQSSVANRTGNHRNGCPVCSGKKVQEGFNDLQTLMPEVAIEWNYDRNEDLTPAKVTIGSNKKVWWKCPFGHEWQSTIVNRTKQGNGCPYCSGRNAIPGVNDLQSAAPQLAEEWNYSKNGTLKPSLISRRSSKKVWWICSLCGKEWQATIAHRSDGRGCPECAKKTRVIKRNANLISIVGSLAQNCPELAKEWHSTKNDDLSPDDVTSGSNQKVWWICSKGHEWKAVISSRAKNGTGCPMCSKYAQRAVICVETGVKYKNVTEAISLTGAKKIAECCKGIRKTSGGYHWKYIDQH